MLTVRCTHKLLKRLGTLTENGLASTTRLGDWYANLLFTRRGQFILCVSERTLLPIILPTRDAELLPERLRDALPLVLSTLGIDPVAIEHELAEMVDVQFERTANRTVLGAMNDLALNATIDLHGGREIFEVTLRLLETPCGPLGMASPGEATADLFASPLQRNER